jgi:kynurenine formamidase
LEQPATPFDIDWSRFRLVDLSRPVEPEALRLVPGRRPDGTFEHQLGPLPGRTGTCVELPRHFYADGKSVEELPLSLFVGRAVLARPEPDAEGRIGASALEEAAGPLARRDDILVVDPPPSPDGPPAFAVEAAHWILGHGIKMLVLDDARLGRTVPEEREFYDILLGRDVLLVRNATGLEALKRPVFFLLAFPPRFHGVETLWVRLAAVVAR